MAGIEKITVRGLTFKYFGGHHSKRLAQAQAKTVRSRGDLATIRFKPKAHFPWVVYWYDKTTPRRQSPYRIGR